MNPLIEEAKGVAGSFDERELIPSISGEPGPNAYRLRLIRRLAAALEAAEGREDRTDTMLTIAIGTRDDALRQLDAIRALLPALKALAEAGQLATEGKWGWFGNIKTKDIYLSTVDRGRIFIMQFARWGMRRAQPRFQVDGIMRDVADLVEVDHNQAFRSINHPDAEFILISANSRPAIAEAVRILEGRE